MRLGLGTVQFGLDYGISNMHGKPSLSEVKQILHDAEHMGLNILDTAAFYGNSEEVLGEVLNGSTAFGIITKTPPFKCERMTNDHAWKLKETFAQSLQKLRADSVYGLLIHHTDDLLAADGERLMDAMLELKAHGLVSKIGVSIYNGQQIERVLERYCIDLIQVPINVFDQRLVDGGQLAWLKREGVEVHARSIFLQGLLLMRPQAVSSFFKPLEETLQKYHAALQVSNLTPLQGALAYVKSLEMIDCVVVGVTTAQELQQIVDAHRNVPARLPIWREFSCNDEQMINPAMWPKTR